MRNAAKNIGISPNSIGRRISGSVGIMNNYSDDYRKFVGVVGLLQDAQ